MAGTLRGPTPGTPFGGAGGPRSPSPVPPFAEIQPLYVETMIPAILTSRWAVGLGAVVLVAGAGAWSGWKAHRDWVYEPMLRRLTSQVEGVQALFDAFKRRTVAEAEAAAAEARAKEASLAAAAERARRANAKRVAEMDRRLRAALDELSDARAEAARAALRPAEASPAECRGYAAGPGQLSVSDASFLIREADRADRIAVRLNACIAAYERAVGAINGRTGG